MRVVFMGTPEFALPSLRAVGRAGCDLVGVVTRPDRPRRSHSAPLEPSPVKREALVSGAPVLTPESVRADEFIRQISEFRPEVIVVVAYGRILPPEVLAIPTRWCINVHASILPKYRGAAPIARAIMAGEKVTGVTTMKLDSGLDTGDILLQRECAIGLIETAGELTTRLATIGADLLVETLERHRRQELEPKRQDAREATPAPPLTREDGRVDWSDEAQSIACRIRGCNPWPLAVTDLRGSPVQLLRAEVDFGPLQASAGATSPGEVIHAAGEGIVVRCGGDGRLSLLELRFPGGRAMSARDALNGRLVRAGDRFASAAAI